MAILTISGHLSAAGIEQVDPGRGSGLDAGISRDGKFDSSRSPLLRVQRSQGERHSRIVQIIKTTLPMRAVHGCFQAEAGVSEAGEVGLVLVERSHSVRLKF